MKIAIITANFGGYEELKPAMPQDGCEAEFICVTDTLEQERNGWTLVLDVPTLAVAGGDNMRAKRPKMLPWLYTSAERSVWVDASFRITSRSLAVEMLERAHPIAQFLHPDRDCIYDEAAFSATLDRYRSLPLIEQMAAYAGEHPRHWGLWAAGVIARVHTREVVALGVRWFAECARWGIQDQVSQAPCLREFTGRPASLPGSLYNNKWLRFEPSQKHVEGRK